VGAFKAKNHPLGRYGYFLEPHNAATTTSITIIVIVIVVIIVIIIIIIINIIIIIIIKWLVTESATCTSTHHIPWSCPELDKLFNPLGDKYQE